MPDQRTLHNATNIALLMAGLAIFADRALELSSRLHEAKIPPQTAVRTRPAPFRPGQRAPSISGVNYASADRTLVLILSTNCKFCRMSAPFYREMASKLDARHRMVAVFPQSSEEIQRFENLGCEIRSEIPIETLGISGTPTAILVSRNGTVIQSWIGAPNDQVKKAIETAMKS